jgi:hypothetical protein
MLDESGTLTFAELERRGGIPASSEPSDEFPLPAWYRTVREVPLSRLSPTDIARACRQKLFVGHVVPIAVAMLQLNPLEGEAYEGELLVSLKVVPPTYWQQNPVERQAIRAVIARVLGSPDTPGDLRSDAEELSSATS